MRQPVEEWLGATVLSESARTAVLTMTATEHRVNGSSYQH
jgi:hypothetical protein